MEKAAARAIGDIVAAVPHLIRLPAGRVWIDYDAEADVLYISLKRPQRATDTVERDGLLLRYRGRELVGVTVLNASKLSRLSRRGHVRPNGRRRRSA
jgi:uncharacterized protein YuzE